MTYTESTDREGFCPACEYCGPPDESYAGSGFDPAEFKCPDCGEPLQDAGELPESMQEGLDMQKWQREIIRQGLWGPSPGGAAAELGCSRAMVDKLVDGGILVRNEFHGKAGRIHIVIISEKSIQKAKENKAARGKWTREERR